MMTFAPAVLTALIALTPAAGEQRPDFDAYDRDGDGYLTEAEWSETKIRVDFDDVDTDKDGFVEESELLQGYPWHVNEFKDDENGY